MAVDCSASGIEHLMQHIYQSLREHRKLIANSLILGNFVEAKERSAKLSTIFTEYVIKQLDPRISELQDFRGKAGDTQYIIDDLISNLFKLNSELKAICEGDISNDDDLNLLIRKEHQVEAFSETIIEICLQNRAKIDSVVSSR